MESALTRRYSGDQRTRRIAYCRRLPLAGSRVEIERKGDLGLAWERSLRPRLDHHLRMLFRIGQFGEGAFHAAKPDISRDQRRRVDPALANVV